MTQRYTTNVSSLYLDQVLHDFLTNQAERTGSSKGAVLRQAIDRLTPDTPPYTPDSLKPYRTPSILLDAVRLANLCSYCAAQNVEYAKAIRRGLAAMREEVLSRETALTT